MARRSLQKQIEDYQNGIALDGPDPIEEPIPQDYSPVPQASAPELPTLPRTPMVQPDLQLPQAQPKPKLSDIIQGQLNQANTPPTRKGALLKAISEAAPIALGGLLGGTTGAYGATQGVEQGMAAQVAQNTERRKELQTQLEAEKNREERNAERQITAQTQAQTLAEAIRQHNEENRLKSEATAAENARNANTVTGENERARLTREAENARNANTVTGENERARLGREAENTRSANSILAENQRNAATIAGANQRNAATIAAENARQLRTIGNDARLANVPANQHKDVLDKVQKAEDEHTSAQAATDRMRTVLDLARSGNKEAQASASLIGVQAINELANVKRVNGAEIANYGNAGSLIDQLQGKLGKITAGKPIPDDILKDMQALHDAFSSNTDKAYQRKLQSIDKTFRSNFSGGSGSGTVRMVAPNGQEQDVPADQVKHYELLGAKVKK